MADKKKEVKDNKGEVKENESFLLYSEAMDEYYKYWQENYESALSNVKKILKDEGKLKEVVDYVECFKKEADVSEFRIENKASGNKQEVDYWFKYEIVKQYAVGDSGDSWAGTVYIPLIKSKYLVFDYSC